jgi:hypothetical protein
MAAKGIGLSEATARRQLQVLTAAELLDARGLPGKAERWTMSSTLRELMRDIDAASVAAPGMSRGDLTFPENSISPEMVNNKW